MNSRCYIASLLLLVLSVCSLANAATRYVSHTGSNTLPYTSWETAANTIEAANIATIPGDTIFIDTGSFQLTQTIVLPSNITLRGKGMDSTTLLGFHESDELPSALFRPADSSVFENIHFIGQGAYYAIWLLHGYPSRTVWCRQCKFSAFAATPVLCRQMRYVEIKDCWFESWGGVAVYLSERGDYFIENNTFDAGAYASAFLCFDVDIGNKYIRNNVFLGGGHLGIDAGVAGRTEMTNNLFFESCNNCPYLWRGLSTCAHDILIANNTFYILHPTSSSGYVLNICPDSSGQCLIFNNIFAEDSPRIRFGIFSLTDAGIRVNNNCFAAFQPRPQSSFVTWDDRLFDLDSAFANFYANPMFVDPESGDFCLQAGSPCIDAGAPWILDVDGTRSDIGAFGGPGGSFYIYQDFPPKMPVEMDAFWFGDDRVVVSWERNSESDFTHYVLFRTTDPAAPLDSSNVLAYLDRLARPISVKPHKPPLGIEDGDKYYDPNAYIPLYDVDKLRRVYYVDMRPIATMQSCYTLIAVDSSGLMSGTSQVVVISPQAARHPEIIGVGNPFPTPNTCCQEGIPDSAYVEQNYPNPFNVTTAIVYSLPNIGAQPAPVRLAVYNLLGQQIKSLIDEKQQPGRHTVYWDGTNQQGQPVASGVYFYRLEVSGVEFVKSGKMILMK